MSPHDEDAIIVGLAQLEKQSNRKPRYRYIVGYENMRYLRIGVKPQNILSWVSERSYETWKQNHIITIAPSSVPGGKRTQIEREAVFTSLKPPILPTPSPQRDLDSEIDGRHDTLATNDSPKRQLNGSLTNQSQLDAKPSQSTTTSITPEIPKPKGPLLIGTARKSSTSASESPKGITEAKRGRSYGHEATPATKLASDDMCSRVGTRSRPSTRIPPEPFTKPLQTTSRRIPSTTTPKRKRSAIPPAPADEEDDELEWDVNRILNHKLVKKRRGKPRLYYYIRWMGDWDDSWEPKENVGLGAVTGYWQEKRRETQMTNLDKGVQRGSDQDPMQVDFNMNGGDNKMRDGGDDEYESNEASLFVGQELCSRGNGIGNS